MNLKSYKIIFVWGVVSFLVSHFHGISIAHGQEISKSTEKPIIIKGLSIGIDINDARNTMINLLGEDYIVSPIDLSSILLSYYLDELGDTNIFGDRRDPYIKIPSLVGKRGFFIRKKNDKYLGFVSADGKDDMVTRISLSGRIIDLLYSTSAVNAEDFVVQFENNFGLPGLPWIPFGWSYSSPHGYTLTIKTDKFIDIKKNDYQESQKQESQKTEKIKF